MLRKKEREANTAASKKKVRPDICLSVGCDDPAGLKAEIEKYSDCFRYIDWQVDKAGDKEWLNRETFTAVIRDIKASFPGKKLMISYRAKGTKGSRILSWAIGHADMISIRYDDPTMRELLRSARLKGTTSIISFRSFNKMPSSDELATAFIKMERLGADILEIACLAETEEQTYTLLQASGSYTQLRNHKPVIAVAMGEEGQASRICAGDFGSVITYGCGEAPTAPGQFNVRDLKKYLDTYYESR